MIAYVFVAVMLVWLPVHKWRDARWLDEQGRLDGERRAMRVRPALPAAAPGEPSQLARKNDTLVPRLVDQGASDDNPLVENS
jgi:hypothetical protein